MIWFNRQQIQARIFMLISLALLVGALTTGWNIYTIIRMNREIEHAIRSADELSEIEEFQIFLLEEQVAMLSFVNDGSTRHLTQYVESEAIAGQYLQQALLNAGSTQERQALNLIAEGKEAFNRAFDEVVELEEAGQVEEARALAAALLPRQSERLEQIHAQVENFVYTEEINIHHDGQVGAQMTRNAIYLGIFTLLFFSVIVIWTALITNQIAERLMFLTNAVIAFENDHFSPDLFDNFIKQDRDFGQFARTFLQMVNSIETQTTKLKNLLTASQRFVPVPYLNFLSKQSIVDIELGDHVSAEMAVMFSDIRSFTTISESMTPQENFDFVNQYLEMVSPAIANQEGFIVKFLGDGMMAIFPYSVEDAIKAGIEKIKVLQTFNQKRIEQGQVPVDLGIGIHTGHMMVGMIGEHNRMQGDAFSDNVNLTARIEGLTKFFGVSMIISGETRSRIEVPGRYLHRSLGAVQVKGREQPITLYEIFEADDEQARHRKQSTLADYEKALQYYRTGNLAEAQTLFKRILEQNPDDKTASFYYSETQKYLQHGLPEYWDGVIVMTSK